MLAPFESRRCYNDDDVKALSENPFFVLGVAWNAQRQDIEREAQKLLGMLELGFAAAASYDTPLGPQVRTSESVRIAIATLRDPNARIVAEFWAAHAVAVASSAPIPAPVESTTKSASSLLQQLSWGPRKRSNDATKRDRP
jgi:hypothetical protein